MYSLVLMAALNTAPDTPQFNGFFRDLFRGGCTGSCSGCTGSRDSDRYGGGCHSSCHGLFGGRIRNFFSLMGCRGSCSGTCHGDGCYGSRDRNYDRNYDRGYAAGCCGGSVGPSSAPAGCFGSGGISYGSCFGSGGVSYGSCFGSGGMNYGSCFGNQPFSPGMMAPATVDPGFAPGGFAQPQVVDYGMIAPIGIDCCGGGVAAISPGSPYPMFPTATSPGDYPTISPPNVPTTMPGSDGGTSNSGTAVRLKPVITSDDNRGTVVVRLPVGGRLFVEGRPLSVTNGERTFVTPPLPTDRDAVYAFKAEIDRGGETLALTRSVKVRAGGTARVDFTDLTAAAPTTLPAVPPSIPTIDPRAVLGEQPLRTARSTSEKSTTEPPTVRPPAGLDRAKITVHLPPAATLFVNGAKNDRTDLVREFSTPQLTPGRTYKYTMKAVVTRNGLPESQEQTVEFRPGDSLTVDFRQLAVAGESPIRRASN